MLNWLAGSKQNEARRLVHQLRDISKRERAEANLLRMGPEAAPALIEGLQSADPGLLPVYQSLLARLGNSATLALVHALLNEHPLLRGRVAEVLALCKDPAAVPALLSALRGEFYTVRARAARALGAIGDRQAVKPLCEALKDAESEVRIEAVRALGTFNDAELFENMADVLLEDPEIEARQAAAVAFAETGHPRAVYFLALALRDPFWWYEREQAAEPLIQAIERMGELAVGALLEALTDSEGTVRRLAARLLGKIQDSRALQPLGLALYDTHFEVGRVAAEALAGYGPPGLKILAQALHHPEAWLRQHAIAGLVLSGDQRIVPFVLDMLKDSDRGVQKQAIRALGALKDSRALPVLQEIALERQDREMSALARASISMIQAS